MNFTDDVSATDSVLITQYNNLRKEMCYASVCIWFTSNIIPDGWLVCNGQAVSRITYADLFAAIGVIYGVGNGSTTFNVPDTRGKFIVCVSVTYSLGSTGGSTTITISTNNLASHGHDISTDGDHFHGNVFFKSTAGTNAVKEEDAAAYNAITSTNTHSHGGFTSNVGSGTSFTANPAYQIFNLIIKV
jgi:microcystin-dependent protein